MISKQLNKKDGKRYGWLWRSIMTIACLLCLCAPVSPAQAKAEKLELKTYLDEKMSVYISWGDKPCKKYEIYRADYSKEVKKPQYRKYKTVKGNEWGYKDKKIKYNRYYYYQVYGYNAKGKIMYQGSLSVRTVQENIEVVIPPKKKKQWKGFKIIYDDAGFIADGIVVYRRDETAGETQFIKKTIKKPDRDWNDYPNHYPYTEYKDKKMVMGHCYTYQFCTYIKIGKKIHYGTKETVRLLAGYHWGSAILKVNPEKPYDEDSRSLVIKVTNPSGNRRITLPGEESEYNGYDEYTEYTEYTVSSTSGGTGNVKFLPAGVKTKAKGKFEKINGTMTLEPGKSLYILLKKKDSGNAPQWLVNTDELYVSADWNDDYLLEEEIKRLKKAGDARTAFRYAGVGDAAAYFGACLHTGAAVFDVKFGDFSVTYDPYD